MSNYIDGSTERPPLWYFIIPYRYLWRFAEEGAVAEWTNGPTICYREELQAALEVLAPAGLPPLTTVLLLLAACRDDWNDSGNLGTLHGFARTAPVAAGATADDKLAGYLLRASSFLNIVAGLPQPLRTGPAKWHLFRQLGQHMQLKVLADHASRVISEWTSGRLDTQLDIKTSANTRVHLVDDLASFGQLRNRFPSTEALALHLRTGLNQLPEPLVLPEAALVAPALPAAPLDLLDQLAHDPRTAGLARLTQQLVAALRIPLHARGASDQPIGGVADIANRGNFDRLLLSELAHDDLSLMARLVNNEALYLRREAPPQPDVKPRAVLLDTTLRMWGVPRVFALAAALAWARNSRQGRPPVPVAAFALGGQQATPLDLETFDGVVAALGQLDPAPHAGPALLDIGHRQPAATDSLLITEAGLLHQPEFARALAEAGPALRFLLTVDRSGELQLYEYQNGHRTLASTARYDLAELLFAAAPRRPLFRSPASDGLAFWQHVPAPLYLPVTGLRMSIKNTFYAPELGVLAINDKQRVLFWPDKSFGARELLPMIEPGSYCFGSDDRQELYVLVSGPELLRVYALRADGDPAMVDLSPELKLGEAPTRVVFHDQCYHVQQPDGILVFDCAKWRKADGLKSLMPTGTPTGFRPNFGHLKRHVNNGYNVLQRVNRLELNGLDELVIEGHELRVIGHSAALGPGLRLMSIARGQDVVYRRRAEYGGAVALTPNELLLFRHFTWPDGSLAIVDPRGLLHLRSADATVPEMAVLLILGQPTAAWAADGTVCGPAYFTGPNPPRLLSSAAFNKQYLQRFIAHLG
ncbi:hypothetical protein GCM10022409_31670 [Hymenobacter glaciei]|uniref:Uncharacterized protein n=1 Tax=Hymenobacter glaciei TaxID=877209 RepID=A0ABP7UH76_9BACT